MIPLPDLNDVGRARWAARFMDAPSAGWIEEAACVGLPFDMFHAAMPTKARQVCAVCPVWIDCLRDVRQIETDNVSLLHGVRGGLSAPERQAWWRHIAKHLVSGDPSAA